MTAATIRSSRRWLPRLVFWAAVFIAIASARDAAFARNRVRHGHPAPLAHTPPTPA